MNNVEQAKLILFRHGLYYYITEYTSQLFKTLKTGTVLDTASTLDDVDIEKNHLWTNSLLC
jgi:hypothetical protein